LLANLLVFQDDFVVLEIDVHVLGGSARRARPSGLAQREQGDQPVQRPAFQVVEARAPAPPLAIVPLPEAEGRRSR
jgi:hypothetical protein